MQIRARLTIWFVIIVAIIQLGASMAIYWTANKHREKEFYEKMKASGISKTLMLMEFSDTKPERLRDLEELSTTFLPREEVLIYNYKNDIVYISDPKQRLSISHDRLDEIRIKKEIRFEQDSYELAGFMFTDRYNRLVVISAGIDTNGWENLEFLRGMLVLVYLLSLTVVSILAWIYSGGALRPIQQIMRQTDQLNVARISDRLPKPSSKDELGKLTLTINRLLDRIETAFQMQKQFVANASHELRTPLTAIKGQLEVVLMKTRTPEVYAQKLESLLADIRQLTTITNQLLLLAQADTAQTKEHFGQVRIDELLFNCQSSLLKWRPGVQILIIFDEALDTADDLSVQGNEELLSAVFYNLIENGIKYSYGKDIHVRVFKQDDSLCIRVEDQGIGIAPAALDKIFQPFFRAGNVADIQGNGLGLSLVERILVMHNGTLEVQSVLGSSSAFTVRLFT
jgi:signal transduction histidine kinase